MVDQGLAVDARGASNRTALVAAASNAQEKAVAALLSLGADPLARTDDGSAAHAAAAAAGAPGAAVLGRLLDHCRPARDALDARGRTPLHTACAHDRAAAAELLVARAAPTSRR